MQSDKSSNNNLRVMLLDSEFNPVERVAVDKETESIYDLKPRVKQIKHRMVCEVVLKDNVKIVTLRSTFNVENLTAVPLEMVLLDENKKQAMPVIKLGQLLGQSCH